MFHHRRGAGSRLQDRGFHGDHHSNHPADPGGPVLVLQLEAGDRGGHISVHPGGKLTGLLHPLSEGFVAVDTRHMATVDKLPVRENLCL